MKYDVLILCDSGIGNAIEALYSVEYCLEQKIKIGIFLNKVNPSFQEYIRDCYGDDVLLQSVKSIETKYLIHTFTYQMPIDIKHEYYFYVNADYHSSKVMSETEQCLSIVRSLYPSLYISHVLTKLKSHYSYNVKSCDAAKKVIVYPGGSSLNSARRWPHYFELINKIGEKNVIVVGGTDDLNREFSYVYPKFLTNLLSQKFFNSKRLWVFLKKVKLLKPHAHLSGIETKEYSYFNKFSWYELVALFKTCEKFIGNDGGLMHLAAAAGSKGKVIFGPTSVLKNKPYNNLIEPIFVELPCSPCQFNVGGISMSQYYINCPYQVKCIKSISPKQVLL